MPVGRIRRPGARDTASPSRVPPLFSAGRAVFLGQRKGVAPRWIGLDIRFRQSSFDDSERRWASRDQKGVGGFRLRQGVFRHRGGIRHINPFVFNLGLFELFVDTRQHLRIPRFVRQVAVVHIAVKRNAVLIADQPKTNLFLLAMMTIVAIRNRHPL